MLGVRMISTSHPSTHELRQFSEVAERIVRESRSLIVSLESEAIQYRIKKDGSFVTEIDLAIEDLIRSRLHSAFPDHGIVGEERSDTVSESGYQWIIDPIDGTHSFKQGIPLYGTLLALRYNREPLVGVIALPALDRIYVAASGLGAYRNGQQLHLENMVPNAMEDEIIAVGERRHFLKCGQSSIFDNLMRIKSSVRTYSDCFGHALAIEGCVGAMVDYNLCIWDIAATEVLIREVGGLLVRVNADESTDNSDTRYNVVFGKPKVVKWILDNIGVEVNI